MCIGWRKLARRGSKTNENKLYCYFKNNTYTVRKQNEADLLTSENPFAIAMLYFKT